MFTVAPESAIMRIGVSIILTWNIGLVVGGSCAPVVKMYTSLLSLTAVAEVEVSPSTDL